jgi:hypothetical protein
MGDLPAARRCEGCAFNLGSEANRDIVTRVKARLAVRRAMPFYCHERGVDAAGHPEPGRRVLCAGWLKALDDRPARSIETLDVYTPEEIRDQQILRALVDFERRVLLGGEPLEEVYALDAEASALLSEMLIEEEALLAAGR